MESQQVLFRSHPAGCPIVMLADHQTTGGYAKIGTVISTDIPAIGQRKPGEKVRFSYISVEEAQKLNLEQEKISGYIG